ncbi:hypothetical protein Tco_0454890 [Tanacetum coccineum]
MPPRRFKKKSVRKIVEKRVAKAIEEYEKTRADSNNTGGSGSANTKCSRLKRRFRKEGAESPGARKRLYDYEYAQLLKSKDGCKSLDFETLNRDDIEAYNNRNVTSSKPATLHDAINMARELIEQGVQAKALRIGDSNKRKWEDQQGNNYHQQQNRRQEAAKVYVAAPTKGRGYAGNLPWCNRVSVVLNDFKYLSN